MGNCMSDTTILPDNVFKVKTVAEDGTILHGFITVTDTDLVFSERDTDTERCWPIGNLRKYDYQKDFFVFEAVDDCHGGDGYHAYNTKQAAALYCMVNTHRCLKFSEAYTPKSELTTYIMSKEIPQRYEVNISGGSSKGSVRQLDTRFGDYGELEVDVQDNKGKLEPNIGALKPDLSVTATPGLPPQSSPGLPPPYSPSSSTSSPATPDTPNMMRFSYSKLLFPDEEEDEAPPTDAPDLVSASHTNEDTASESPSPTSPEVPCVFPKCPPRRQGSAKRKGKSSKSSLPVIPEVLPQVPAIPPKGILPSNQSDAGTDRDQSSDDTTSEVSPQVPPRPPKGVVTADQSDDSSAPTSPEVPPIPPRPSKVSDTNSIKAVADSRSLKRQNSRSLPVVDHFKVPYKDLDFSKMDSLAQLTLQRELEQVIEKERRKQARASERHKKRVSFVLKNGSHE